MLSGKSESAQSSAFTESAAGQSCFESTRAGIDRGKIRVEDVEEIPQRILNFCSPSNQQLQCSSTEAEKKSRYFGTNLVQMLL